jgi:hypothetical protein
MVAGAVAPLSKVVEMVDRSEAYVGVFAWRYGYVPAPGAPAQPAVNPPNIEGAKYGETSITHYEYLRALQRKLPVMAFLLDEQYPWPPQFVDGFDPTRPGAPPNAGSIRTLRQAFQQERVVSWFTTPADLEARVAAAVTMAGLTRQLDLQRCTALDPAVGAAGDTSAEIGITEAILSASDQLRALKIDLATTWWSTRLYLFAALADRLTQVRRILIVDSSSASTPPPAVQPGAATAARDERCIGQLSTAAILATIGPRVPALKKFERSMRERALAFSELREEIGAVLESWRTAFKDPRGTHVNEDAAKMDLTAELLRRWFGDALLQQPVDIADLQRASVVDILRLLDYPNDYVPVLTRNAPTVAGAAASERIDLVDKRALNARLARSYLVELMDRARIV